MAASMRVARKLPAWDIIVLLEPVPTHTADKMVRSLALALLLGLCLSALGPSVVQPSPKNEAHSLILCAAPASVDFGKMSLHSPSAPAFVTITNCGKTNIVIDRVSTTNSREFTGIDSCPKQPIALAPKAACTVGVRFYPDVEGPRQSDLLISTSKKDQVTVRLAGTGVASTTTLSSTQVIFLPQLLGTQSKTSIVRIRNGSIEHALHLDSARVEGDFVLVPELVPCAAPGELSASMTCDLAVSFAPRTLGSLDGRLIINDSDPASPHVIGLHGTGTGIEISPAQLSWDRTVVGATGEPKEFKIRAVGEHPIQIESIETQGDFEQHNSCGTELRATSCTVTVAFTPKQSGKRVGTVRIMDSDPTRPQSVFLIGQGGVAAFLPSALVFEPQKPGTTSAPQMVTLRNYGNNPFTISTIDVAGDFAVPAKTCGQSLQAGQSCTISVTFSPTRSGVVEGFVAVHESADRTPVKVSLSGTGS